MGPFQILWQAWHDLPRRVTSGPGTAPPCWGGWEEAGGSLGGDNPDIRGPGECLGTEGPACSARPPALWTAAAGPASGGGDGEQAWGGERGARADPPPGALQGVAHSYGF